MLTLNGFSVTRKKSPNVCKSCPKFNKSPNLVTLNGFNVKELHWRINGYEGIHILCNPPIKIHIIHINNTRSVNIISRQFCIWRQDKTIKENKHFYLYWEIWEKNVSIPGNWHFCLLQCDQIWRNCATLVIFKRLWLIS